MFLGQLREDIRSVFDRDPAARSAWEVLTCYPGIHALILHRIAHALWQRRLRWLGRFVAHLSRFFTYCIRSMDSWIISCPETSSDTPTTQAVSQIFRIG